MPEKAVLPQTHLIRYAPKAKDTRSVLPEMVGFKDPLTIDQARNQLETPGEAKEFSERGPNFLNYVQ